MKRKLLGLLRCPVCKSELDIRQDKSAADAAQDSIESGVLECASCRREYKITDGIAVFIEDKTEKTEKKQGV
ncbi:MAG: Trm112 family protein [Endomicrobiia bacterium]|nr:Trm112 family protein [Endomicrobiia bacterium]